ncbi:MAG: hypothetical protein AUK55_05010 [Syntrophobacteraceae bacterium CG2_30_61_12]|nr:MAG: hypothetical protein AUK55_05010 [Syntrophobacteraceae bacterium CG2_30_61_12]
MLTDHQLVPDPHGLLCHHKEKAQSPYITNFSGNSLRRQNRLRETSGAPAARLQEGLGQNKVALGLQFPQSLEAAAGLTSTTGVKESVVIADLICNGCSVHSPVLIKHRTDMLDDFGTRQRPFDLVLGFHADMLDDMESPVQSYCAGNGQS